MAARQGKPTAVAEPVEPVEPVESRRRQISNKRYGDRRAEIVDLAAERFAANGYDATGIRDIGEAANLARGALYYYIDSKESLLGEIYDQVLDPLMASTRAATESDASASARIRMVSETLIAQLIERHDHVWVFLHEYRSLTGERQDAFLRKRREFEDLVSDLFAEGVANGEFEIDDVRLTTLAFLGMHNYTYQWVHSYQQFDSAAVSKLYCDVFLTGIAARRVRRSVKA